MGVRKCGPHELRGRTDRPSTGGGAVCLLTPPVVMEGKTRDVLSSRAADQLKGLVVLHLTTITFDDIIPLIDMQVEKARASDWLR